jgi:GPH family glycoside/pentoside/hexuronide:cation symporter
MTAQTRDRSTLPLADKLLYATASIGNNALFWAQVAWIGNFYAGFGSAPARMSTLAIGIALGAGKLIELFDDPLIGWWSDVTRTRWGRRIPFILFGTPVLGISFWMLWNPPPPEAGWVNIVWFFVSIEAFFLARTVIEAPYEALQAEITTSSTERVSLRSWTVSIGIIGVVLGMVMSGMLIEWFGYGGMGLLLAVIAVVTIYTMLFGLWRRGTLNTGEAPVEKPPLFASLMGALRNRNFRALALSFMLFSLGYQVLATLIPPFVTQVLGLSEGAATFFLGGVMLFVLLSVPMLNRLARHFTKRRLYASGMLLLAIYLAVASIGMFVQLIPGVMFLTQTLILTSLAGLGFGAMWVYPLAMVADIIDEDKRTTGNERAAVFYGMFKTLEKIAQSIGVFVWGAVLTAFGSSAAHPLGIQLLMPIGALAVFGGFVAVWWGYRQREAPGADLTAAEVQAAV